MMATTIKGKYRFESYTQPIPHDALIAIKALFESIFESEFQARHLDLLNTKEQTFVLIAYSGEKAVGYKVGYEFSETTFYSWLGGVLQAHRGAGIASELMHIQHVWAAKKGYTLLRTKTLNRWKAMLILNIKFGFDIVGLYYKKQDELQIILEKKLLRQTA